MSDEEQPEINNERDDRSVNDAGRRLAIDIRRSQVYDLFEDLPNDMPIVEENALTRRKLMGIACKYFVVSFIIFLFILASFAVGVFALPDSFVKEANQTWMIGDRIGWSAAISGLILPVLAVFYNCSVKCCRFYCIGCRDCILCRYD